MNINGDAMIMNMNDMKRSSLVTEPENRLQEIDRLRWKWLKEDMRYEQLMELQIAFTFTSMGIKQDEQ